MRIGNQGVSHKMLVPAENTYRSSLIRKVIPCGTRVAVIGASGWFGKETLDLLLSDGNRYSVRGFARTPGRVYLSGTSLTIETLSLEALSAFEPEVLVDCAFVTREHATRIGLHEYETANREIMERVYSAIRIPSIRKVIGFSSGVALPEFEKENPALDGGLYALLKREYEQTLEEMGHDLDKDITVLRTFSVSGKHINRPHQFAFSSLVLDAIQGAITIRSPGPVLRRYIDIADLITAGLVMPNRGFSVIESGGDLIEIEELAEAIRRSVNQSAEISRSPGSKHSNFYASDGTSWENVVQENGLRPNSITKQIETTLLSLQKAVSF